MNEIQNRFQNLEEQGLVENIQNMYDKDDFDLDDVMDNDKVSPENIIDTFTIADNLGVISKECTRRAIKIVDNWEEVSPELQVAFITVYDDLNNSFGLVCKSCDIQEESLDKLGDKLGDFYEARKELSGSL